MADNKKPGVRSLLEEEMQAAKMGGFAPGTSGAKGPDYVPEGQVDGAGNDVAVPKTVNSTRKSSK